MVPKLSDIDIWCFGYQASPLSVLVDRSGTGRGHIVPRYAVNEGLLPSIPTELKTTWTWLNEFVCYDADFSIGYNQAGDGARAKLPGNLRWALIVCGHLMRTTQIARKCFYRAVEVSQIIFRLWTPLQTQRSSVALEEHRVWWRMGMGTRTIKHKFRYVKKLPFGEILKLLVDASHNEEWY